MKLSFFYAYQDRKCVFDLFREVIDLVLRILKRKADANGAIGIMGGKTKGRKRS